MRTLSARTYTYNKCVRGVWRGRGDMLWTVVKSNYIYIARSIVDHKVSTYLSQLDGE